jgi:hypothetical protein
MAFVALVGIALLGNGLKAVVTSTVLVGEAQFAAFLAIPVEHVATLMEAIIAGMVVALAAIPLLLQRFSARALAMAACVVAMLSFGGFALVDHLQPSAWQREIATFTTLTVGAGAVACLAPVAQALVLTWPTAAGRTTLTTLWTGAAPGGFLVAPQLVKYALPVAGLAAYFVAFAVLPLVLLALLLALGFALRAPPAADAAGAALPVRVLFAFIAVVVGFEAWSTLGSVTRYTAPATLAALLVLAVLAGWLGRAVRALPAPDATVGSAYLLLAALFVVNIATTGFFEAAYLTQRFHDEAFVADRSTIAAAAQIAGTLAAGVLAHRCPAAQRLLLHGFAVVTLAGLASYVAYPSLDTRTFFLWTPAVTGFGSAGLTVLVCLAVLPAVARVPMLAALPSIAIMLGTEFGLEVLQLMFAVVTAPGTAYASAYATLFAAQAAIVLAVPWLLAAALRRGAAEGARSEA